MPDYVRNTTRIEAKRCFTRRECCTYRPCSSTVFIVLVGPITGHRCNQLHRMIYRLAAYAVVSLQYVACLRWYQLLAQACVRDVAQSHVVRFEPSSIVMCERVVFYGHERQHHHHVDKSPIGQSVQTNSLCAHPNYRRPTVFRSPSHQYEGFEERRRMTFTRSSIAPNRHAQI